MKRNSFIVLAVVVIVLAIAGVFGWQRVTASAAVTGRPQTVGVQRGPIVATVSAAGNVSAPEEATIEFPNSGKVAKLSVQVGDLVKKGQVLVELDTTDQQLALRTAQASLANATASLDLAKIKNSGALNQVLGAKAALDKASNALKTAQGNYDGITWRGDVSNTTQAYALQNAKVDYNTALANYNIAVANMNDTAVRQAQAAADNAQTAVEQAQYTLDQAKIVAPFDGTVSAVNVNVGDTVGGGTVVSVANLASLQVKVLVAEVDMAKLEVGDMAQLTLDALPGKSYTAQVLAISPAGTVTQGVVNYPITVAITTQDAAIKPGMTANLSIAVDRPNNVLTLPSRAVRTQGNQKSVTVLYQGQTIQVPVQTGLGNDTTVEIVSGLQAGDQVVLNQTTTTNRGAFGGGPAFFGPGR